MKFTKLETQEQFNQLKKGDLLIVKWRDPVSIEAHEIYGLIHGKQEVLLNKKTNRYFIIKNYLNDESYVKEAYLVTKD